MNNNDISLTPEQILIYFGNLIAPAIDSIKQFQELDILNDFTKFLIIEQKSNPVLQIVLKLFTNWKITLKHLQELSKITKNTILFNENLNKKLIFKKTFPDSVRVQYYHLPNFLTKTYTIYDEKKIVPNENGRILSF